MAKERDGHFEEDAVLLLNKGKRGLLRMVFGRTMVIIVLLAVQVVLLLVGFLRLGELYYGSALAASLVVALVVISRKANPSIKITWIFLILVVPVFAIPFYFLSLIHILLVIRITNLPIVKSPRIGSLSVGVRFRCIQIVQRIWRTVNRQGKVRTT